MRRFARILFNVAAAVSLSLCVATCMLWVRSHWVYDLYKFADRQHTLKLDKGHLWAGRCEEPYWIDPGHYAARQHPETSNFTATFLPNSSQVSVAVGVGISRSALHFLYVDWVQPPSTRMRSLAVPMWFIAGFLGIVPVARTWRWMKNKHGKEEGLCPSCGYDLRASPDRCPECGRAVEVA